MNTHYVTMAALAIMVVVAISSLVIATWWHKKVPCTICTGIIVRSESYVVEFPVCQLCYHRVFLKKTDTGDRRRASDGRGA